MTVLKRPSNNRNQSSIANEKGNETEVQVRRLEENTVYPDGVICSATGRNGQVHLYEDRVLITRKGFVSAISFGFRGDKEILLQEITSIGWKDPGIAVGYIHFGYRGGHDPINTGVFSGSNIVNNENAVIFAQQHQADFKKFRKVLEGKRAEINRPQATTTSTLSPMDELKKLAELRDMGVITSEEFEAKKAQLLEI